MNPLTWKHAHLVAWAFVTLGGALIGMLLGWWHSPFAQSPSPDKAALFIAWLHYPMAYGPWLVFGGVVAGLAFYSADLLTGAR